MLRGERGELEGLWLRDLRRVDGPTVAAVRDAEGLAGEAVTARYRVVHNTFNRAGGAFVRFVGDADAGRSLGPPRQELVINDQPCLVHDDIEAFGVEVAAGRPGLLRTTIAGASMADLGRIYEAVAEIFGEDTPKARAAVEAPLLCLVCLTAYPATLVMVRDHRRGGGGFAGMSGTPGGAARARRALEKIGRASCRERV